MTLFQAAFLGLVQGVTEFLPISSSGHLTILQQFLGLNLSSPVLFDISVHLATLIAILLFFFFKLLRLTRADLINLAVGTLPIVVAGIVAAPYVDSLFTSLLITAASLLVTAILLFLSSRVNPQTTTIITPTKAFIIGLFQSAALLPGLSRSGSTISSAMLLSIAPQAAFDFSFILGIPAILGALVFLIKDLTQLNLAFLPLFVGFISALFSGLISLQILSWFVKRHSLLPFSLYTFLLSLSLFGLLL